VISGCPPWPTKGSPFASSTVMWGGGGPAWSILGPLSSAGGTGAARELGLSGVDLPARMEQWRSAWREARVRGRGKDWI
jgi:hypothetical protein